MNESKKQLVAYFENMSLFIVGLLLLAFPIIFLSITTDAFILPKQIILILGTALSIVLLGVKTLAEGKFRLRNSPFDVPVNIFLIVALLSAVFSLNRYDAFTAFVPLLFIVFLYYTIINVARGEKQLLFILASLNAGAVLSGTLTILSFLKIYPLPFSYTHVPFFTTFGSLLDQAIYLSLVLPISGYFAYIFISSLVSKKTARSPFSPTSNKSEKSSPSFILFALSFIVIASALAITVYMLLTTQKPFILPLATGLQTAFAAISQDSLRLWQSFLLGSGLGTYINDFTRFKPAIYNTDPNLWTFTFFRSSSFALELLATTGLLGIASFLFLVYKIVKEKNFFLPLIFAVVLAFVLPYSFISLALFFILLAIFAVVRIHSNPEKYSEVDFYLVALKRGLLVMSNEGEKVPQSTSEKRYSKLLPITFFAFLLFITGLPLYFAAKYAVSDFVFQQSLVAASQNNGIKTYELQTKAIKIFPYRDIYHRSFSQTNLALANAFATNQQKSGKQDEKIQQNILTLIQQSITEARTATQISPLTSFNWNNLSSIYRSLIGFGQNADRFTILTAQQAIALDPNNPQQYVDLGGIYYQLGQYDEAIRQFQIAINLKNDYANAYYNLAHALEQKGSFDEALQAYKAVKTLVANNPENVKKIDADIEALKKKAGEKAKEAKNETTGVKPADEKESQEPLDVNKPATTLPERDPQVKIPAPTVQPIPTSAARPTPNL